MGPQLLFKSQNKNFETTSRKEFLFKFLELFFQNLNQSFENQKQQK